MTNKPIEERTFFSRDISLWGLTEHASRYPDASYISIRDGCTVYDALSVGTPTEDKYAAIKVLSEKLDKKNDRDVGIKQRDDFLWAFFEATQNRFIYFAIEDTEPVSKKMAGLIIKAFAVSSTSSDKIVLQQKRSIVSRLQQITRQNYEDEHPDSERVPNRRAEAILKNLQDIVPSLFTQPR